MVSAYEVSQTASLAGDEFDCDPLESSLDQSDELRWEVSGGWGEHASAPAHGVRSLRDLRPR